MMRPPRTLPLFFTLIALALPAGAQIKGNVGADTTAGVPGQAGSSFNSGASAPRGRLNTLATLSPLSLSPTLSPALSAPAASLAQGLAPSALSAQVKPAAAAAAATPPKTPPSTTAAAAAPPGGPPFFISALVKLGVTPELAGRLEAFLATRHPGDQGKIYHGLDHSHEVADLAARLVSGQDLPAEKKILLILSAALHDVDPDRTVNTPARVSATIAHLTSDDEARGLLVDFSGQYGFTAAQVKALIMATDFALDPISMKVKQDAFAAAAKDAFPAETDWALSWGQRLAFADQTSTYVGSLTDARQRVAGLAVEVRDGLEASGKGPGPSDAVILAGTYKFLSVLRQNELFALLPAEQRSNFAAVQSYFEQRQTPEAWSSPAAPPLSPELASARRYINAVMGGIRAPTEREMAIINDELDRAVAKYPDNEQGQLMRSVAGRMGVKSGNSIEEIARDGVFLYADFTGDEFQRGYASRDPDIQNRTIAFYVTRKNGRWRIDVYRQHKSGRSSDESYINALKSWLRAGGIPSSDF